MFTKICPHVLANGHCSSVDCAYQHRVLTCDPCGFLAQDPASFACHMKSRRHLAIVSGRAAMVQCPICASTMSMGNWPSHLAGQKHGSRALLQGLSPQVTPEAVAMGDTSSTVHCSACKTDVPRFRWAAHAAKSTHVTRETFQRYRAALDEAEKDKNDLHVEGGGDLGYLDPSLAPSGLQFEVRIEATSPRGRSMLREVNLASRQGTRPTESGFSVQSHNCSLIPIIPGRPTTVRIQFQQRFLGRCEDRLELVFEDTQLKKNFVISRLLRLIVGNKSEHESLQPTIPYVPRTRTSREPTKVVVEGPPPATSRNIPYVGALPRALIPKHLLAILDGPEPLAKQIAHIQGIHLPVELNSSTYARQFKNLLWIEEHKSESDLERYDMSGVTLEQHNQYYYLGIPGLAEKRPSVLVGDKILVQKVNAATGYWFEGHVHVVRRDSVGLCFHGSFSAWRPAQQYNVRFKLNRIVVRRQHQALDSAFEEDRILFPVHHHVLSVPRSTTALAFYNPLIVGNEPQVRAVTSIVNLPSGSPPFVVFGPPGTGKTITIVEAILQVIKLNPATRILACAPSNSAADLIAERLCGTLPPDALIRMYAPSRFRDQAPDSLRRHVSTTADGHFSVPHLVRMMRFRVVVATCVAASMAAGIGMPRGHFSHIFVDEAGQATEPEAFISIKTLADSRTNVVLSGDPKQLGPIIRSPIARKLGLEISYLERLMNSEAYDLDAGYSSAAVKLIKNFRSHAAILKFPNDRFYSSDLQPCADPSFTNTYLSSPLLPNPGRKFPVVFHSVIGKDDREATSPSFFNIDEVLQVKAYISQLKENRTIRTSDHEIGVIAPYHAQCLKIRNSLRSVADSVKVGSVEEFQGQERKVIIISTVRSSKDFVEYDLRHTLGFVANPRRFNVAVTRAKALLIVVGNPNVLGLDPLWRSFLNYVYVNGGWTGATGLPWDLPGAGDDDGDLDGPGSDGAGPGYDVQARREAEIDMNAFTRRMEELAMGGVDDEGGGEDDAGVDRPWRDVE